MHLDCGETPVDHAFVQACVAAATEAGIEPVIEGCHFHTDMGWPEHAGIPIVNFAAGDPRKAHQDDEFVTVHDYLDSIKMIASLLMSWCGVVS